MKTTMEEKLMRGLEKIVDDAAIAMNSGEFRRAKAESRRIAQGVIGTHRKMIGLWTAMDKRMQKRALKKKSR